MIFRYKRFFSSLSGKYLGIGLGILVLIIVGSVVPKFLGNKDNVVLAATNLLTNGDFETWSGGNPTGWSVLNPGGSGNGTLTQETTIKHAGASSEKNTCGSSGPTHSYQAYTFATAGDTYVVSAWGYTPSANTKMAANILVLDGEFGTTATQLWNFSTNAWEAIVGNNPTPGITPINTVGNTWEQISENITVPASKQVVIALINQSSGASVTGEAVYYDDVSLALPAAPAVYNGNLLSVNSDSKTKLVWANDLYYLAFSSSTADGTYNVYMTTSTTGVLGTWSEPRSVFTGIKSTTQSSSNYLNGFFAFDYNSVGNYFGLAAFASSTFSGSGTGQVWFTSSTNAFSWSATTTVGSNLTTGDAERQIYMDFSETEEFVGVTIFGGYSPSTQSKFYTVYSTNKGVTWTPSSALVSTADDNSTLIGFKVSGTGASRIFHMGYYQTALPFNLVYASSTDNIGTSWTTSTLASPYVNLTGPGDIAFSYLVSLAVDDNGLPGVLYFDPISSSGSGPFNVAANLMYQKKGSNGSWTTTNLGSNSFVLTTYANHQPMNLMYFNTNDPITFSLADGATPLATANTSTLFGNLYSSATPLGDRSGLAQAYNTTSENWAGSWVTSAGQLTFVTSSLPIPVVGSAPTAPSNFATSTVTASTIGLTWTDNASDETAFDLGTSTNGTSFTSSTIAANATSATVNTLNPNTAHWFLLAAYNSYGTSTYRSLTQTYTNPAVPGVPVVTAVTTSTLTLTWNGSSNGSGTTYQVYNDTDSSVVGTTTNTTYPVTGLTQGTEYKFNVRARYLSDGISYSAYSTTSTATTTLAYGVTLSKTTGAVTEDAGTDTYTAVLKLAPTADVVVTVAETSADFSVSPTTLTFTTANWNTPQTVTITATADTGVEGTETGTITHTATSVDGYYNGISIGGVTVTITDNDVAASGGGGGSSVSGVYNPILSINNGATSTSNNLVTLTLGASGASEMIISENFGFLGASWEPVTSSKSWPLSSATGTKNIYVRYRDSYNNFSSTVSSAIVLLGSTSFISTTPSLLPTPLVPIIIPVIKTPVVVETPLIVLNPESKIVISNINSLSLQPATSLMFNYSYTNDTEQMRKVRLVRQVLNAKGTIIASTQAYRNIKAGDEVSIDVKQLIGRYWTPGEFIERVRVFDSQGKMIEENSFPFVVEKFKYKYLIKGELGFDNSIVFDPTVWAKNKIEVRTPFQLRIRFSYTNQTEVKQDVRMLREIVDATGMIISTLRGRWSMNPAETYGITVNQNIPTTLLPGEYAVRIRALDYKTGDLLAENSAGFTIELK